MLVGRHDFSERQPSRLGPADRKAPGRLAGKRTVCRNDSPLRIPFAEGPRVRASDAAMEALNGELGDCLCIPFMAADGKPTRYARLKPDCPAQGQGRQADQIRIAKGASNRAFIPARHSGRIERPIGPVDRDGRRKKSSQGGSRGFPLYRACRRLRLAEKTRQGQRRQTARRTGIDRRSCRNSLARPARVYLLRFGRRHKANVRRAEWHLAEALARKGAVVKFVRLPQGDTANGKPAKIGLDDYLVANGPDALRADCPPRAIRRRRKKADAE